MGWKGPHFQVRWIHYQRALELLLMVNVMAESMFDGGAVFVDEPLYGRHCFVQAASTSPQEGVKHL